MKKQIFAILVAAALFMPLAACGGTAENTAREHGTAAEREENNTPFPEGENGELPEVQTDIPGVSPQGTPETETETEKIRYIQVKTDGLNIRTGAGTGYRVLAAAQKNTLLGFEGEENGWYKTKYLGKTAYVSANAQYAGFFSMETGSEAVEKVIREGLACLGTPYVYGAVRLHDGKGHMLKGFTTDAFDCSSLMQYIFYRGAGIRLGVTTRTQVLQGKEISRGNLQRGDLMFFTNASRRNETGNERIGHVALYLGENYILHTASDFAKIEQISSARWSNFVTARRVI